MGGALLSCRRGSTWSRTSRSSRPVPPSTSSRRTGASRSPPSPAQAHTWSWAEFQALPHETPTVDLHCVTKWSKLGTHWEGISLDTLLEDVETAAEYAFVSSYGGYTTNLPLEDLQDGKAWLAFKFDDEDLEPVHGGPVRLLVPHLYLWKSAKWVKGIDLRLTDEPGFWETLGYNNYGDPWREQRYWGD